MKLSDVKEKEKRIYDALAVLSKTKRFYEMKISDIAKQASIGKGTVYEYFQTKEDILEGFVDYVFLQYFEAIDEIMKKNVTVENILWQMVDYERHLSCDYHSRMGLMTGEVEYMANIKASVMGYLKKRYTNFGAVIKKGITTGELQATSLPLATILFVGTISNGYFISSHIDEIEMRQIFDYVMSKLK